MPRYGLQWICSVYALSARRHFQQVQRRHGVRGSQAQLRTILSSAQQQIHLRQLQSSHVSSLRALNATLLLYLVINLRCTTQRTHLHY